MVRLTQVLAAEQVSKKRERGLCSQLLKSVGMMGRDRRTHSELVGLLLSQKTGTLNPVLLQLPQPQHLGNHRGEFGHSVHCSKEP